MKVTLKPGVELDVLTQAELHATLTNLLSGFSRGPNTTREDHPLALNASGDTARGGTDPAPLPIFRVPAGYRFALHRLALQPDGTTFGTEFTNASGYVEVQRAGIMQDGASLAGLAAGGRQLPLVFRYGTSDAPIWDNGQTVDLLVVGGPHSVTLQASLQGTLEPLTLQ